MALIPCLTFDGDAEAAFWAKGFGTFTGKFGGLWMVNVS